MCTLSPELLNKFLQARNEHLPWLKERPQTESKPEKGNPDKKNTGLPKQYSNEKEHKAMLTTNTSGTESKQEGDNGAESTNNDETGHTDMLTLLRSINNAHKYWDECNIMTMQT